MADIKIYFREIVHYEQTIQVPSDYDPDYLDQIVNNTQLDMTIANFAQRSIDIEFWEIES